MAGATAPDGLTPDQMRDLEEIFRRQRGRISTARAFAIIRDYLRCQSERHSAPATAWEESHE